MNTEYCNMPVLRQNICMLRQVTATALRVSGYFDSDCSGCSGCDSGSDSDCTGYSYSGSCSGSGSGSP